MFFLLSLFCPLICFQAPGHSGPSLPPRLLHPLPSLGAPATNTRSLNSASALPALASSQDEPQVTLSPDTCPAPWGVPAPRGLAAPTVQGHGRHPCFPAPGEGRAVPRGLAFPCGSWSRCPGSRPGPGVISRPEPQGHLVAGPWELLGGHGGAQAAAGAQPGEGHRAPLRPISCPGGGPGWRQGLPISGPGQINRWDLRRARAADSPSITAAGPPGLPRRSERRDLGGRLSPHLSQGRLTAVAFP